MSEKSILDKACEYFGVGRGDEIVDNEYRMWYQQELIAFYSRIMRMPPDYIVTNGSETVVLPT